MDMTTAEKVREIMALVGSENIEEFAYAVKNEYGAPGDWDLTDESFMNKARLCAMWHFEKTVIRARYITAVMDVEIYKDREGIDAFDQYNGVIREFPE